MDAAAGAAAGTIVAGFAVDANANDGCAGAVASAGTAGGPNAPAPRMLPVGPVAGVGGAARLAIGVGVAAGPELPATAKVSDPWPPAVA